MKDIKRNLTMLCDYYELTMSNGYFVNGMKDKIVYFDVFYRDNPDNGGYAIAAGLEQAIEYIRTLRFTPEDIEFLRQKGIFSEGFLEYLKDFRPHLVDNYTFESFIIKNFDRFIHIVSCSFLRLSVENIHKITGLFQNASGKHHIRLALRRH